MNDNLINRSGNLDDPSPQAANEKSAAASLLMTKSARFQNQLRSTERLNRRQTFTDKWIPDLVPRPSLMYRPSLKVIKAAN